MPPTPSEPMAQRSFLLPSNSVARELPNLSMMDFSSVGAIRSAIRQMSMGYFEAAAQLVDAMSADDRIQGVSDARFGALPGLDIRMEPAKGRKGKRVAKAAEKAFERMYPDAAIYDLLRWGRLLGVGLGQNVVVATEEGLWETRLKVWHPRFVYWDDTIERFQVLTTDGPVVVEPGDGQWVLFCPYGVKRGWMQGRVRALGVLWCIRQFAMRDWARWSESYGGSIKKAFIPPNANAEDRSRFVGDVALLNQESVIVLPGSSVQGEPGFDVQLLEAQADSAEGFQKLKDACDTSIAICMLGQNLTTEVSGGSFAAAKVHANIRGDILESDAQLLGQCLREQSLAWWASYNFGDKALAPLPVWDVEPPENKKESGDTMKSVGEGITALRAAGVNPDVDAITERMGIPTLAAAEAAPEDAEAAQDEAEEQAGPTPPRRRAVPGAVRPTQPVATASALTPGSLEVKRKSREVEGQLYVDELAGAAAGMAGNALAADVVTLLDCVAAAEDFEDLRKRLLVAYGAMQPDKMVEVMQKALLLAELKGAESIFAVDAPDEEG